MRHLPEGELPAIICDLGVLCVHGRLAVELAAGGDWSRIMNELIDREKLRAAIRQLSNEYIYYMLVDALDLLPPSKLVKLVGRYLDIKSLQSTVPNRYLEDTE